MAGHYNPPADKQEMVALIRGAVERGVTTGKRGVATYGRYSARPIPGSAIP